MSDDCFAQKVADLDRKGYLVGDIIAWEAEAYLDPHFLENAVGAKRELDFFRAMRKRDELYRWRGAPA